MNAQFKKGVLELCVLSKLADSDQYGYELTEAISKEMVIATGTLYLVLKRLKDEDYVETYLVESGEGPARKYYHLTESGKEYQKRLRNEWFEFVDAVARVLGEYDVWDPKHFQRTTPGKESKAGDPAKEEEKKEEDL